MNKKIGLVAFVLLGAFGASASLIQVSVTGTADTTEMGYTQGESYTFNWIVNDGYTGGASNVSGEKDEFDGTKNQWFSRLIQDPWLWASISGNGLLGTYSRPVDPVEILSYEVYDVPYDQLLADNQGLYLRAGNYYPDSNIGLLVNGIEVKDVIARDLNILSLDYSDTSFVNPATYLEGYLGAYSATGGEIRVYDEAGGRIDFSVSGVTIGVVPEPSTVLLFSIGGIGAWVLRRNKMKGEVE